MSSLRTVVSGIAVIASLVSGCCWMRAAYVKVLAKSQNVGVGYGGTPINVRNERGEVLDFLETYSLQSKWNSRAAFSSAVAAFFSGLYFLMIN
jgi:hypothetical protein